MGSASHSSKRKKKRSQKPGKKRSKSIREKTKKLKRRHDSDSCSDVDDKSASISSESHSSSSLDDKYRSRRRARSRDRKRDTRKGSKKKIKRDSSMSDSSGDSRRTKKRKRSKKKWNLDSRKKHNGKKKRRREPSSSSSSDRSGSCSIRECSDDSKRQLEKKEDKLEMKKRDRGEKGRERTRSKRSRRSSRSCSPCSLRSESHSYASDERLMEENPPKRLKSVIVVMRQMGEAQVEELNRDELKDEIVYEHDDYPSRSNDSNDGTSKGEEALPSSRDTSDEKTMYMEEPSKEAGSLDVKTSEFSRIQRLDVERSEVSTADASSNSVDLETMLRQKALENLLKRQGKVPTKIDDGGNQGDHHVSSAVRNPDRGGNLESAQKAGMNDDVMDMSSVLWPTKESVHQPISKLETELPIEKGNASANPVISRPKLGLSTSTRRLLGPSNTWRRDPTLQGYPRSNLSTPKEAVIKDSPKSIESQSPDTERVAETTERPAVSRGESTTEVIKEDEDSEFEQKTMTVMRGGELVQVSYKVKIPKKAPALARRQFKR